MNENPTESLIAELTAKVDALVFGYKTGALAVLLLCSFFNVRTALVINVYQQIFADALPGKPLPSLTLVLVNHQTLSVFVALLWPVLGFVALARVKKLPRLVAIVIGLLFVILFQLGLTWQGLLYPLFDLVTGMSDTTNGR